jgi:two-component system NtrC family sensor kinase
MDDVSRREGTILTFVEPIYNEPSCSRAACHVHSPNQRVLGILEADFSLATVDQAIQDQTVRTTVFALALMAGISIILYGVLRKFVLKPVTTLSDAMETVARGDLGRTVQTTSNDEIGLLVHTFNDMTQELKAAREKMVAWTETLEREVAIKTDALKKSQDKLVQAEKLAALGRLTADVAHEIRNPLTAIGGFARRLYKNAASDKEKERAEIIVFEVDRLEKILRDVLTFSRDARFHLEPNRIEEFVYGVASMHEPACSEQSITVELMIEKNLAPVLVDGGQVRQSTILSPMRSMQCLGKGTLKITAGTELHGVRFVRDGGRHGAGIDGYPA